MWSLLGRILDQRWILPRAVIWMWVSPPHSPCDRQCRADINPHTRPQGSQVSIKTKYQPAINCNQCCNSPVTNIEISSKFEIHVDFSWNFFSSECKIFVVVHQSSRSQGTLRWCSAGPAWDWVSLWHIIPSQSSLASSAWSQSSPVIPSFWLFTYF